MGETREDRCDLAYTLKEIGANVVPINILNPIEGTPFAKNEPLPPLEILKTIACFRFILPRQEIMIAGGRTVNLRDLQSMIFMAGASALMVGNYLTTLNQPVEIAWGRCPHAGEMDAYERVLGDAMAGDATLFAREDYVEEAWRIVDPVLKAGTSVFEYNPNTWGPTEVENVTPAGGWHNPVLNGC